MNSILAFSLAVFAFFTTVHSSPLSRADDLQPTDRQIIAELATKILKIAEDGFANSKRNAELINSLLGLPKMMNDAGK
uniref:Pigment-dispersing factor I n=1 Tax=Principapillatus hitoyensis TaxID=1281314 RepID=A0A0D3QSV5_9BILA|nr:pigment-dispersing factor I precursor [Principapillatus hitoyensis]